MTRTTPDESASSAGTLLRLVERIETLAAQLKAVSARQRALIEADDSGPLLETLAHRQAILDDITETAARLAPLRDRWLATGDPGGTIRRRLDLVAAIAADVAAQDGRDQARLRERRDEATRRLAEVGRGRGALAAYARQSTGHAPGAPEFQDTEA